MGSNSNYEPSVMLARDLVEVLSTSLQHGNPIGTMSPSLYDTAWVSMVYHRDHQCPRRWLSPNSFERVLDAQLEDGSWPSYSTEVDGILNSLACLLSLHVHQEMLPIGDQGLDPANLKERIAKARSSIVERLSLWDVSQSDQVGFELLIPNLLDLLQSYGSQFDFPSRQVLEKIRHRKMKRFREDTVYAPIQTTLLHSLEAFAGKIDFDKAAHNGVNGSMFGSPASTAAYLIYSKNWDESAETYLKGVLANSSGKSSGAVPSAFPSPIFEVSWIATLFFDVRSICDSLESSHVECLRSYLRMALQEGGGTIGFAPGYLQDADDTAMSIVTIGAGVQTESFCESMVARFFTGAHFATYAGERNPSISANCNVIRALLTAQDPYRWVSQLKSALEYVCTAWYSGDVQDKWNTAPEYTYLTLAKCLRHVLRAWDEGKVVELSDELIRERLPVVTIDIVTKLVQSQAGNGAWGQQSCEITAFACLGLLALYDLPWFNDVQELILERFHRGQGFLLDNQSRWTDPSYTWVEKVSYASPSLAKAYCAAATAPMNERHPWGKSCLQLVPASMSEIRRTEKFIQKTGLFQKCPTLVLRLGLIQSQFFIEPLRRKLTMVFQPRSGTEYQWLSFVPFTWIGCRNLGEASCTLDNLKDLMVASMLIYQADEFMETVVASGYPNQLPAVEVVVSLAASAESNDDAYAIPRTLDNNLSFLYTTFRKFADFFVSHPGVRRHNNTVQLRLRNEIMNFLQAHCKQIYDSKALAEQENRQRLPGHSQGRPTQSFFRWVRGTSADHTSAPFCLVFYLAIVIPGPDPIFDDLERDYLTQDLCRHIATRCRLINDYSSVERDMNEGNLNSVDFPEVKSGDSRANAASVFDKHRITTSDTSPNGQLNDIEDGGDQNLPLATRRSKLLHLAQYEQDCLDFSCARLAKLCKPTSMDLLRLFIHVTELYNQMYLIKDLTSRSSQGVS